MAKLREIYIVKFDGIIGAMGWEQGNPEHFYSFCPKGEFAKWAMSLREKYPEFTLRCVNNEGIENWLRKKRDGHIYIQTRQNTKQERDT